MSKNSSPATEVTLTTATNAEQSSVRNNGFSFHPATGASLFTVGSQSISSSCISTTMTSADDNQVSESEQPVNKQHQECRLNPTEIIESLRSFLVHDEDTDECTIAPKTESEMYVEPGSFYSVRCKLFYQKEGAWHERGVGNLFLKHCGDDDVQLLIRADTRLGNILLNIKLVTEMPISRQGKNNVSLVCEPNPPIDSVTLHRPVCMLIRVKTADLADDLFSKIKYNH